MVLGLSETILLIELIYFDKSCTHLVYVILISLRLL